MKKRVQGFDEIEWSLVANYINGESSTAERRRVEEWIGADLARRAYIETFHKIREECLEEDLSSQTTAAWNNVIRRIKSLA
jgi:hypothetical protein